MSAIDIDQALTSTGLKGLAIMAAPTPKEPKQRRCIMISWHAVIGGSITTVIIVVLKDLVYVLFASLIGAYGNAHPWFVPYMEHIWFTSALIVYCFSMILGGGGHHVFRR